MTNNNPAVLLLIFNRPDTAKRVFDEIRAARPSKLYVAADGPRSHKPGEAEACRLTREITTKVDWPCAVKTLFRQENLGCKKAVGDAITWFFEQEDEGIILEDDCLPNQTFFRYASELLTRYRDDSSVMLISGSNIAGDWLGQDSYFFSSYSNIRGWSTWKRAWRAYDPAMKAWKDLVARERVRARIGNEAQWKVKQWAYGATHAGRKDSWAYAWEYAVLAAGGVSTVPRKNLIENIGFDGSATHTSGGPKSFVFPRSTLDFPLAHPETTCPDRSYDSYFVKTVFMANRFSPKRVLNLLRRLTKVSVKLLRRLSGTLKGIRVIRPDSKSPLYYLVKGSPKLLGTVVDVGCGFDADFSMHMISAYGLRAFGVDPTRKHAEPLKKLECGHSGLFTHVPVAVSGTNGTISFNESVDNVSGSLIEDHRNIRNQAVKKYEVESVDMLTLPSRLGMSNVPYIKLDLEGAEYGLIDSLKPGDLNPYGQLFIEFHHHAIPSFTEADTKRAVEKVRSQGFKAYSITGRDYLFFR